MKRHRIKIKTIIKAIRKNGYKKGRYLYHDSINDAYCAFGQASKNLGFSPSVLGDATEEKYRDFFTNVIDLNDHSNRTLPQIADELEKRFSDNLDTTISFTTEY